MSLSVTLFVAITGYFFGLVSLTVAEYGPPWNPRPRCRCCGAPITQAREAARGGVG